MDRPGVVQLLVASNLIKTSSLAVGVQSLEVGHNFSDLQQVEKTHKKEEEEEEEDDK